MSATPRFRVLVLVVALVVVSTGCVTTQPTVTTESGNASVFQSISTNEAWGTNSVQASVSLTPDATTTAGVTRLTVIGADGGSFYSTGVETGETSVTLPLPTSGPATLVAANTVDGTTVATANVTVTGTTFP